jgi:hypothetical protein
MQDVCTVLTRTRVTSPPSLLPWTRSFLHILETLWHTSVPCSHHAEACDLAEPDCWASS